MTRSNGAGPGVPRILQTIYTSEVSHVGDLRQLSRPWSNSLPLLSEDQISREIRISGKAAHWPQWNIMQAAGCGFAVPGAPDCGCFSRSIADTCAKTRRGLKPIYFASSLVYFAIDLLKSAIFRKLSCVYFNVEKKHPLYFASSLVFHSFQVGSSLAARAVAAVPAAARARGGTLPPGLREVK